MVVGYKAKLVETELAERANIEFVLQAEQLGTGHAVQVCQAQLQAHDGPVLVVTGDSPLIQTSSLAELLELYQRERPACILGTLIADDPSGLGRIVRDADDRFVGIVEEKDASEEQRQIKEVNMSTYVFECRELLPVLSQLRNDNRQGEFYITDCPGMLKTAGKDVRALPVLKPCEGLSVNNLADLAAVEQEMRRIQCEN